MREPMPQEIQVWDILPAIRREFAKVLIKEHELSQREAAKILRVTEPAVSQYIKSKRAKEIVFGRSVLKEIKNSAKRIMKDNKKLVAEMQRICNLVDVKRIVCEIHRSKSAAISKRCVVCLQ